MTALSDLIARLEDVKEGSRELDATIFCVIEYPDKKPERNFFYERREEWGVFVTNAPAPGTTFHDAPHYTTSLDAALTLVPEGWMYQLLKTSGVLMVSGKPYSASIKAPSEYGWVDPPRPHDGYADTMALALCIATLKAREAGR